MLLSRSGDPQIDPPNILRVMEVEDGIFYICDDGPVEDTQDLIAGPFSVKGDADFELDIYSQLMEDCF